VQPRDLARLRDALAVGPGVAIGDVVLDRGGEQERVLLDQAVRRSDARVTSRTSWSSIVMRPALTS
jgi:hypothetical protein